MLEMKSRKAAVVFLMNFGEDAKKK